MISRSNALLNLLIALTMFVSGYLVGRQTMGMAAVSYCGSCGREAFRSVWP
jgi:hypothetical protein